MYVPTKADSLGHLLTALDEGADEILTAQEDELYPSSTWESVVVVTDENKLGKFSNCIAVTEYEESLTNIFPKTSALAGWRKDKKIPKGWIRYKDRVLQIICGDGSANRCHKSMKNTAFAGCGVHAPSSDDQVVARVKTKVRSLHDLLCKVESLLSTSQSLA